MDAQRNTVEDFFAAAQAVRRRRDRRYMQVLYERLWLGDAASRGAGFASTPNATAGPTQPGTPPTGGTTPPTTTGGTYTGAGGEPTGGTTPPTTTGGTYTGAGSEPTGGTTPPTTTGGTYTGAGSEPTGGGTTPGSDSTKASYQGSFGIPGGSGDIATWVQQQGGGTTQMSSGTVYASGGAASFAPSGGGVAGLGCGCSGAKSSTVAFVAGAVVGGVLTYATPHVVAWLRRLGRR